MILLKYLIKQKRDILLNFFSLYRFTNHKPSRHYF